MEQRSGADSPAAVDPVDVRWGRRPGARPPIPTGLPWVFAVVLAVLLAVVVLAVVRPAGPLDQPDLAYQRDGLLDAAPVVPAQVDVQGRVVGFGSQPVALLFLREPPDPQRLRGWLAGLPAAATPVVVVQSSPGAAGEVSAEVVAAAPVVWDPDGRLAAVVALPTPNDGGRGIGYAVVDSDRVVRYSTLDPRWYDNAFEVATIIGATR